MSDSEPPRRSGPSVPSHGAPRRKAARPRTAKGPASRPHLPEAPRVTGAAPPARKTAPVRPKAAKPTPPPETDAAVDAAAAAAAEAAGPGARKQARIEAAGRWDQPGMVNAKLIYAAYLVSPALPITALAAFAFAHYARRRRPPAWLASHYTYQIRTFWGAAAGYVLSIALAFAGGGVIIYPLVAVWLVARSVHGIVRAAHAQRIDDPDAFLV
ncbi:hypothetical protein [Acuticoccus sp. I52.16.1]|uniref:DUF4870 family protein n=1 Tax=Acuticoccus sp. I52.16.1 TaxID=2928472 RepID=UPI001FD3F611|nr:hypothetical protein [Acuticoccus sp. I52.16.1]UOM33698.1 hypothetical protein MRB58_17925 [Acuticoccus sp. I52.16.1]